MEQQHDGLFDPIHVYECAYEYCDECRTTHSLDKHEYEFCMVCDVKRPYRTLRVVHKRYGRRALTCGSELCNTGIRWHMRRDSRFPEIDGWELYQSGAYILDLQQKKHLADEAVRKAARRRRILSPEQ